MNLARVDQIAKAVLYEGYMLYPYRPSSVKNRQRWNFGVVYPQAYSEAQGGEEACSMRTECLVSGNAGAILEVKLRFLQLQTRSMRAPREVRTGFVARRMAGSGGAGSESAGSGCWRPSAGRRGMRSRFPPRRRLDSETRRDGRAAARSGRRSDRCFGGNRRRMICSRSAFTCGMSRRWNVRGADRDAALMQSLVSTHMILGVRKRRICFAAGAAGGIAGHRRAVPERWRVAGARRRARRSGTRCWLRPSFFTIIRRLLPRAPATCSTARRSTRFFRCGS